MRLTWSRFGLIPEKSFNKSHFSQFSSKPLPERLSSSKSWDFFSRPPARCLRLPVKLPKIWIARLQSIGLFGSMGNHLEGSCLFWWGKTTSAVNSSESGQRNCCVIQPVTLTSHHWTEGTNKDKRLPPQCTDVAGPSLKRERITAPEIPPSNWVI